ncbi:MAG: hypothetical protein N2444_06455 [Methylocystis sp.]|nr:hypothetical protein [Methylocystis sp.]
MPGLKRLAAVAFCVCVAAPAARAQTDAEHTLEAIFHSLDENHDNVISMDEINRYIESSFKEMDPKHSGVVTIDAFRRFSVGLADVAAQQGRGDAYDAAKDAVFKRWSGGKTTMTLDEYRRGVLGDAKAAGGDRRGLTLKAFGQAPFIKRLMRSVN